jgi:uncharacterized protein with HEPN domain
MLRSFTNYLNDLIKASDLILEFTKGMDRDAYLHSVLIQSAVERQFIIIGEAMAQMRDHYPDYMHLLEEAKLIVGFRNILVHEYNYVDRKGVWSIVEEKLPEFRQQVLSILDRNDLPPLTEIT